MKHIHNIVIVTNSLDTDSAQLIKDSLKRFNPDKIRINLLHVIPKIPEFYYQVPSLASIEHGLFRKAKAKQAQLAQLLDGMVVSQMITNGCINKEVLKIAKQLQTKFIIYGEKSAKNHVESLVSKLQHRFTNFCHRLGSINIFKDNKMHLPEFLHLHQ